MKPLFFDPTPRIERADSFCVVDSITGASASHAGVSGVVGFCGRSYAATIAGDSFAGCRARFVQTKTGSIWAIPEYRGGYRSAFPRQPRAWSGKAPASLALAQLLKRNRRLPVYRQGKILSVAGNTATLRIDGAEFTMPSPAPVSPGDVGKHGLAYVESGAMSLVYFASGSPGFSSYNQYSSNGGMAYGYPYSWDGRNKFVRVTVKNSSKKILKIDTGFAINLYLGEDHLAVARSVASSISINTPASISIRSINFSDSHCNCDITIGFISSSHPSIIEFSMNPAFDWAYTRFTSHGNPLSNADVSLTGYYVPEPAYWFNPSLSVFWR